MKTHHDVVTSIHTLLSDLEKNPNSWENPTLERYLEAMAAWLEAYVSKNKTPPSWELIIKMLEAAKIYE